MSVRGGEEWDAEGSEVSERDILGDTYTVWRSSREEPATAFDPFMV